MRMNLDCDKNEIVLVDENEGVQVTLRYHNKLVDIAVAGDTKSGYMTIGVARWLQKAIGLMLDRAVFIEKNCKTMDTKQLAREVLGSENL